MDAEVEKKNPFRQIVRPAVVPVHAQRAGWIGEDFATKAA